MYFLALSISIVSSSKENQENCKNALATYVEDSISVSEKLNQDVLKKWTQPAITEFYYYCYHQHVVCDMNIVIGYIKLFGAKEGVRQVEMRYYQEQARQSEQARLAVIARDIIWAVKTDDTHWGKYVPELNARIEDAHSSKLPKVNINLFLTYFLFICA